ncbi:hypothetical protein [Sphingomonas alba]|uniref:17 kDa surface antigen n=1 Tax=Sphingomonas alba TaxID=2908208 RepID=A0ABT0RLA6_9SPHN|nr:hypothetical protein [Sphingomonas alba]MCL6683395.1 hypothetical protein [Sphingomonas alba]
MKAITKIMAGAAGLAAIVASAPAAAQYGGYPGGAYPGYGYGYGNNPVGNILDSILGGRSYQQNERYAVEQCVRAVEYRINTRGLDNEGGRYRNYGYGYGYNNGYNNGYMGARVVSVTQVSPRSNGGLKVYGLASTGMGRGYGGYNNGYNGYNGYGYDRNGYGNYGYNGAADAQFNCSIDRGGRITDIDAKRNYAGNYPYRRY